MGSMFKLTLPTRVQNAPAPPGEDGSFTSISRAVRKGTLKTHARRANTVFRCILGVLGDPDVVRAIPCLRNFECYGVRLSIFPVRLTGYKHSYGRSSHDSGRDPVQDNYRPTLGIGAHY